jgi:hypothetical protein
MQLPHTDAVGLAVVPDSYSQTPGRHSSSVRLAAALLVGTFLAVVSVTTAVSLGAYCLTTDTANTTRLPSSYLAGSK